MVSGRSTGGPVIAEDLSRYSHLVDLGGVVGPAVVLSGFPGLMAEGLATLVG
jgi:hypothetical protein